MTDELVAVPSPPGPTRPAEEGMLQEDMVREIIARLGRGERVKAIARTLGIAAKTVQTVGACGSVPGSSVTISSITPNRGFVGTIFDAQITGTNFTPGIAVGCVLLRMFA